jgi:hypothetical protein
MEKVVEIMGKIFASKAAKLVGVFVLVFLVGMLSSFSAQNIITRGTKEQLSDYIAYQNKQIVIEALNETVMPTLMANSEAIARLEATTKELVDDKYAGYIKDITKYYEKMQKGDTGDFTKTNFEAMSGWWIKIPDDKKTDALKMKYAALMAFYPNIK